MAFDPDAYLAKKSAPEPNRTPTQSLTDLPRDSGFSREFNPDIYLSKFQEQPDSSIGDKAQTFTENVGNEISMGYLPQLQALASKPIYGAMNLITGQDVQPETYLEERDSNIIRQQEQSKRNKGYATAGQVAGIGLSMAPIASGVKALGLAGKATGGIARLKDAGKVGAVMGGVYNPGDNQGELSPFQIEDRAKNSAIGAGTGLLFQSGGALIGQGNKVLRGAPKTLEKASEEFAFRALGPTMKDIKKLAPDLVNELAGSKGKTSASQISKTLIDNGIIQAGDTAEDILKKSSAFKSELGQKLDDIYTQVDQGIKGATNLNSYQREYLKKGMPNGKRIAAGSMKEIKASLADDLTAEIAPKTQKALNELSELGETIDLRKLRKFKTNLDQDIKYHIIDKMASDQQKQLKSIRRWVAKEIENYTRTADKVLGEGSDLVKALKETNKKYGHAAAASDIVEDQLTRNLKNQAFSLTDKMVGAASMAGSLATAGSPVQVIQSGLTGLAASTLSKYGRKYAAPIAAKMAKRMGENLKSPAGFAKFGRPLLEAAQRSPEEFQAVLQQFANNPEFTKLATQGAK